MSNEKNKKSGQKKNSPSERQIKKKERQILDAWDFKENPEAFSEEFAQVAKIFCQMSFPHSETWKEDMDTINGDWGFRVQFNRDWNRKLYGLPYGVYPRLIMIYLMQRAYMYDERRVKVNGIAEFIRKIGKESDGRTVDIVYNQTRRLLHTEVIFKNLKTGEEGGFRLFSRWFLDWNKIENSHQTELEFKDHYIELSSGFYERLKRSHITLNLKPLKELSHSALLMDIYVWLTYRLCGGRSVTVSWKQLHSQFGANYKDDRYGLKNFRTKFLRYMKRIQEYFPEFHYKTPRGRLTIVPLFEQHQKGIASKIDRKRLAERNEANQRLIGGREK